LGICGMNQEIRELILDWKDRGKASFNELPDDVQNVIVSSLAMELGADRRFESIEDMCMAKLQMLISYNAKSDYLEMGKTMSGVLWDNMRPACEELYNSTTEDREAAHMDDRIDAIQAKAVGL
jgi:hypothetical protein